MFANPNLKDEELKMNAQRYHDVSSMTLAPPSCKRPTYVKYEDYRDVVRLNRELIKDAAREVGQECLNLRNEAITFKETIRLLRVQLAASHAMHERQKRKHK